MRHITARTWQKQSYMWVSSADASKHVKENYAISASQLAATLTQTFRLTGVCIVIQLSTNFVEIWESISF